MNILGIADVHLHDYAQRNPTPKFRLYQSDLVADNIIKVGKENNCEIIVIAGDLLEKAVIRPYIVNEVWKFLNKIMSNFREGYILLGNHDCDNKSSDQGVEDSIISFILPSNLHLVDKKIIQIGSSSIAFSNWKPKFNLSWIQNPVDVFFSHATIAYSNYDYYTSQYLDQSKFRLAFLGDIHKPAVSGKLVSIGCPQKCKMGDSDDQTGIVYDTETKLWKHVNLNPDDNLLKFKYTTVRSKEGYNEEKNTYYIYKPSSVKLDGGVQEIQIPQWDEINNLINSIIAENNLSDIHGKVLSNINMLDEKEVDFNFTLNRLTLSNFRSISDCDIYFEEGDKILITGENGNGKSSLLLGLKYALLENRFMKDFVQFDTNKCEASVELTYQNKSYKILRGSKDYGLWINNQQQKYNNKKEFEEDVRRHLPFIDYMDIYFFTSETSKIIGSLTPERKSDIISKFFKLDKIDLYNCTAINMSDKIRKEVSDIVLEIQRCQELIKFIDEKIKTVSLPSKSLSKLNKEKENLLLLQNRYFSYIRYKSETSRISGVIESYKYSISKTKEFIDSINIDELNKEEFNLSQKSMSLNSKISDLKSKVSEKRSLKSELEKIISDGSECYINLSRIKENVCPTCGQKVTNDKLSELEKSLTFKMNSLLSRKSEIESRLLEMNIDENTIEDFQKELGSIEMKRLSVNGNIRNYESSIRELSGYESMLNSSISELNKIPKVDEVDLPSNFQDNLNKVNEDITTWNNYNSLISDRKVNEDRISENASKLELYKNSIEEFDKYIKLTGSTGKIYEEIMNRLAVEFSDNIVKYEVNTYKFRNKDHLDLSSYYNVKGRWVAYQSLSSGQATVADINFLSKIVTRMGLLVMDEFLKHLSPSNHDICIDILSKMNVGCILLSSHMESIMSFNNKTLDLSLNDSGITTINIR
jgi:ABC-type transport system involved in cytochrome c biogenesis ATPase subunit/cell division protein FtsL/Icc-related predicted phosphoesterase